MASVNASENPFDYERGFIIDFNLKTGASEKKLTTKRTLSEMRGMFVDDVAYGEMLQEGDPVIYEFHEMCAPENEGDLAFGCSITYPGKVGHEYFMTKGHFHAIQDTAEIYYCIGGHGFLLMENPEGDWSAQELMAGKMVYVPKRYAHRSVNVSETEPLVTFFAFRADAGHDYGTIETKGYRKLIVEQQGQPMVVDNPKWGVKA